MPAAPNTPAATLAETLQQAHGAERFGAARSLYEPVLTVDPQQPDALPPSGIFEVQLGQHERAAELIGRVIDAQPNEASLYATPWRLLRGDLKNVFEGVAKLV